ncbi:hypothetical protein A0H81_03627 [Grifola frondosa]|uniref:Uncharacterized protein n=1 Tax=Grifola frondosa TaxID=5627 RepID=A0A1C7MI16_GRIFR|nr:hypothetical protein A0H81_03627 [Grifola frondosa]
MCRHPHPQHQQSLRRLPVSDSEGSWRKWSSRRVPPWKLRWSEPWRRGRATCGKDRTTGGHAKIRTGCRGAVKMLPSQSSMDRVRRGEVDAYECDKARPRPPRNIH